MLFIYDVCHAIYTDEGKHLDNIAAIAFVKTTEELYIASSIVGCNIKNCILAIDVVQKSTANRAPNTNVKIRSLENCTFHESSYLSISCSPCGEYLAAHGSEERGYGYLGGYLPPRYFVDIWCCSGVDDVKLKRGNTEDAYVKLKCGNPDDGDAGRCLYSLYRRIRCRGPAPTLVAGAYSADGFAITFSTNSSKLMITNALTNSIEVHNVQCAVGNAHSLQQLRASDEGMISACFSHDGSIVLSASSWLPAIQVASNCAWDAFVDIESYIRNDDQELKKLVSNPGAFEYGTTMLMHELKQLVSNPGAFEYGTSMLIRCVLPIPGVVKQLIDPDTGYIQDISLRLACCTLNYEWFSGKNTLMADVTSSSCRNALTAGLVLKNIALAWYEVPDGSPGSHEILDCVDTSELCDLLLCFPALASDFMVQQVSLVSMQFEYVTSSSVLRELKEQWTHTSDYRSNFLKQKNLRFEADYRQGLPEGESYQYNYYNHIGSNRSLLARKVIDLREYSENVFKTLSMKWYELFPAKQVNASCLVLPLKGFHTSKVQQMFVDVAAVQRSTEIFQSDVVSAVIDLHWDMYGKKAHMYSLCIKCAIVLYLVSQEIVEAVAVKVSEWLLDFWNVLDVTAYTLTLIAVLKQATATDTTHPELNTTANIINATAAVLLWFKLLHFMRPYQSTGPLVMMIFEIIADIRTFLLILAIVVVGFANAFYVILSKGPTSSYSTPYLA
eukprot:1258-Heterococcus_DN1.PRE.1